MAKWDIAAQNIVYADIEGNIAYHSTGEIPVRADGDGRYPVPGWTPRLPTGQVLCPKPRCQAFSTRLRASSLLPTSRCGPG